MVLLLYTHSNYCLIIFDYQLPKEVGLLSSLSSLNISHNPNVSTIPDEIGKLSKLWEVINTDLLYLQCIYILSNMHCFAQLILHVMVESKFTRIIF